MTKRGKEDTDLAAGVTVITSIARNVTAFEVPVQTVSEANQASSRHWRYRWARAKQQREAAAYQTRAKLQHAQWWLGEEYCGPLRIDLTRCAPGTLDSDNLAGSMKHVRDGIADALNMDDGDKRLEWAYAQERTKRGVYFVRVEMSRIVRAV